MISSHYQLTLIKSSSMNLRFIGIATTGFAFVGAAAPETFSDSNIMTTGEERSTHDFELYNAGPP